MEWVSIDAIYVINLPERIDRRREIERELRAVGLETGDPRLVWVRAVRPMDAGEFPSVGARGCFLSHLACLKEALDQGHQRILIVEDDACFPRHQHAKLQLFLDKASRSNWAIWYGGGQTQIDVGGTSDGSGILEIDPTVGVQTSHCVALQGDTIGSVRDFFEVILGRPGGHPDAGPMHVDGAYSTWRARNPAAITLISVPPVCVQRSSRSDIAANRWFDRVPVLRKGIAGLRRLRNYWKA